MVCVQIIIHFPLLFNVRVYYIIVLMQQMRMNINLLFTGMIRIQQGWLLFDDNFGVALFGNLQAYVCQATVPVHKRTEEICLYIQ